MMLSKKTYELSQNNCEEGMPKKGKFSAYKGLTMALMSGVLYSISAVIVKQMKNIHPSQLTLYSYLAITIFSFPEAIKCKENLLGPKNFRLLLILRTCFNASAAFLNYVAFRYLPLGEGSAIIFSFPIFVTIAAKAFLKEHCGKIQFLTVLVTVCGIILITKVPQKLAGNFVTYTAESIYGFLSAVSSVVFCTFFYIAMRKIKTVHHSVILFSFGWFGVLEIVILTAIFAEFQLYNCGLQRLYVITLCFLGYANQKLLVMSLQCEMAGPASTGRAAATIVFAFVWQILLFQDTPDLFSLVGACLVTVSVIFVAFSKWVSSLSKESLYREKFSWILK